MGEHEPRIYFPERLSASERRTLTGDRHHHVARVLRLRAGATLTVFDGAGGEYSAVIEELGRREAVLFIGEHRKVDRESPLCVRLAQGIGRGERTDFAIQKAVELGATEIVPLLTRRGVVKLDADRARRRLAHWQGIAVHACQQSGRNRLPSLHSVVALDDWLGGRSRDGLELVLDPDACEGIGEIEHEGGAVTLLVGPEGGFDPSERDAAVAAGFRAVRLGPRTLRTETAAIAALAAVQSRWGDL